MVTSHAISPPCGLRCEYQRNPLGLEKLQPRLSWQLSDHRQGAGQTAWQVIAASSPEQALAGKGELWDSGKVESHQQTHVPYEGSVLQSRQCVYWRVRYWDQAGAVSEWSELAWWEMGLLATDDWQGAQWITHDQPEPIKGLMPGPWVWHPQVREGQTVAFRQTISLPTDKTTVRARMRVAFDTAGRVWLNGKELVQIDRGMEVKEVILDEILTGGDHLIAIEACHDTDRAFMLYALLVEWDDGSQQIFNNTNEMFCSDKPEQAWQERVSDTSLWEPPEVQKLSDRDFPFNQFPFGEVEIQFAMDYPAPMLRREFHLDGEVARARLYVCGVGYQECYCNGTRVGDHVLDPAQTDYEDHGFYVVHDLTSMLKTGMNALGVIVGNGWYNQDKIWGGLGYGTPGAIAQVYVEYRDGREEFLVTDASWSSATGPLLGNNVHIGEVYDARLERPGWATIGYPASDWSPVKVLTDRCGSLRVQSLEPIRRTESLLPRSFHQVGEGSWIFDFGQNFAGWVKIKIKAPAGTEITLRFAEWLDKKGQLSPASTGCFATWVVQQDRYTCKGEGLESWEPRFTYHGFQYVEVRGLREPPTLDLLEGIVVHTDLEQAGSFQCSDPWINRYHEMALWTQRSNMHGLPTDCPHRERCGWLGDAHITAETTIYAFGMQRFWRKYMDDMILSLGQGEGTYNDLPVDPRVPTNIAPGRRRCQQARTDWAVALVLVPWYLHLYYGDLEPARTYLPQMRGFLDFVGEHAQDLIVHDGYGDWCPPGGFNEMNCPVEITSTAFYHFAVRALAELAAVLGEHALAREQSKLASEIRDAFHRAFYLENDGGYGSQTADAMALYLDLAPEPLRQGVADALARRIREEDNNHITVGIHGMKHLFAQLCEFGHGDLVWELLQGEGYPGLKHQVELGATTLWESMQENLNDSYPMSLNHPMQNGYDAWFTYGLTGIQPTLERPGFRHVILRPHWLAPLEWARSDYETLYGKLESHWRRIDGKIIWDVTVPAGATASVWLPVADASQAGCNGVSLQDGCDNFDTIPDALCCAVTSGQYRFTFIDSQS